MNSIHLLPKKKVYGVYFPGREQKQQQQEEEQINISKDVILNQLKIKDNHFGIGYISDPLNDDDNNNEIVKNKLNNKRKNC